MNREHLIERKETVRAELARLRRQLAELRGREGQRPTGRVAELEGQIEALLAEEGRLRLLIDRAKR